MAADPLFSLLCPQPVLFDDSWLILLPVWCENRTRMERIRRIEISKIRPLCAIRVLFSSFSVLARQATYAEILCVQRSPYQQA